jgi:hypothetical protein
MNTILWAVALAAQIFTASVSPHFVQPNFNGVATVPFVVTVKTNDGAFVKVTLDGPVSPTSERPADYEYRMRFEFPRLPVGNYQVNVYLLDTTEHVIIHKDLGAVTVVETEHDQEILSR